MRALRLYAGPTAREHLRRHGLRPQDVRVVPGAAGGPKGLILGPLDRFLFGEFLAHSPSEVALIGASIGAWRMATACLADPVAGLRRLEHDYIHQEYEAPPGRARPSARHVSERFGENLRAFYEGRISEVLQHPRYRLHVLASHGRHVLSREHPVLTPLGYLGAFLSNAMARRALGAWLERVVFSSGHGPLPFATRDFRTRSLALTETNFTAVLQASCSIPFVLQAVHDVPGAPRGAYWDGGITDYHLHLDYRSASPGLVLYPHFQKAVVPGWLDKALKSRHRASAFLDKVLVLAPDPAWVARLPNGKLPDRTDFARYGRDAKARAQAWTAAVSASQQLADEFAQWIAYPDPARVESIGTPDG